MSLIRKYPQIVLVFTALAVLFVLRGGDFSGFVGMNTGYVFLNRGMRQSSSEQQGARLERAENFMRKGIGLDSMRWRGLAFVYGTQGKEEQSIEAWSQVDSGLDELLHWGDVNYSWKQNEEALGWYTRAVMLAPNDGDIAYKIGLAHEGLNEWDQALDSYKEANSKELISTSSGDIFYRIGYLQFRKVNPPELEAALASLDHAISTNDFSVENLEIQSHYQRGELLRRMNRQREALAEFMWVTGQQPEHYSALVSQGVLAWQLDQDFAQASTSLQKAISLQPDSKWAYRGLGQVYEQRGQEDEAIAAYRMVLSIDPEDSLALQQCNTLGCLKED